MKKHFERIEFAGDLLLFGSLRGRRPLPAKASPDHKPLYSANHGNGVADAIPRRLLNSYDFFHFSRKLDILLGFFYT
jgi:hypothetical protein